MDNQPDYKFNEGALIQELKEYIDSTYGGHYWTIEQVEADADNEEGPW